MSSPPQPLALVWPDRNQRGEPEREKAQVGCNSREFAARALFHFEFETWARRTGSHRVLPLHTLYGSGKRARGLRTLVGVWGSAWAAKVHKIPKERALSVGEPLRELGIIHS